jgi:hypothetical protein
MAPHRATGRKVERHKVELQEGNQLFSKHLRENVYLLPSEEVKKKFTGGEVF